MENRKRIDEITHGIIGGAIRVHRAFGPGLFEKAYTLPLIWELEDAGLDFIEKVPLHIHHAGRTLRNAYFIDLVVEDLVVVEIKAVEALKPVHLAQTITYVRLAQKPAGLLINFNVARLVDGVRRVLNDGGSSKSGEPRCRVDNEDLRKCADSGFGTSLPPASPEHR